MMKISKLVPVIVLLLTPLRIFAAEAAPNWIENTLYGSGKMNTVLIVVMIILLGLAFWMFNMDKKLKRTEKELELLKGKKS